MVQVTRTHTPPKTAKAVDPIMDSLKQTAIVTLDDGTTLEVAEPSALDSVRLIKIMGSDASNEVLANIYGVLISIKKINGEPVVTSNEAFLTALLQRFGSSSNFGKVMKKVTEALDTLVEKPIDKNENETDTEYAARVAEVRASNFKSESTEQRNERSTVPSQ